MKVPRRALYRALQELSRVADQRASTPALRNVLLQSTDGILTLTATDLTTTVSHQTPAELVR